MLDAVSEMVWKYFLFPFERLLLTLVRDEKYMYLYTLKS